MARAVDFSQVKYSQLPTNVLCIGYGQRTRQSLGDSLVSVTDMDCCRIAHYKRCGKTYRRNNTAYVESQYDVFQALQTAVGTASNAAAYTFNLPLFLEISDFRHWIDVGGITLRPGSDNVRSEDRSTFGSLPASLMVLTSPPDMVFVRFKETGGSCMLVGVENYGFRSAIDAITMLPPAVDRELYLDDMGRARVWDSEAMLELCAYVVQKYLAVVQECRLGSLRYTLGSQAVESYRNGRATQQLATHDNAHAIALERAAYFAGRSEALSIGAGTGKFYYIDISAMYSTVATNNELPISLAHYNPKPKDEYDAIADDNLFPIARVYVDTESPIYPVKQGKSTIYPVGKFNTVLCGDELRRAFANNEVKICYEYALYHTGNPFAKYAADFQAYREKYRAKGDNMSEYLVKRVCNALWGRLAQRGLRWVVDTETIPAMPFGCWLETDTETGEELLHRSIAWEVETLVREGSAPHTFPAAAAAITSYGRIVLHNLCAMAGWQNVYYLATDGIITNQRGYSLLSGLLAAGRYGPYGLRLDVSGGRLSVSGRGMYKIGDRVSSAGMQRDAAYTHLGMGNRSSKYDGRYHHNGELKLVAMSYPAPIFIESAFLPPAGTPFTRVPTPILDAPPLDPAAAESLYQGFHNPDCKLQQ